MVLQRQKLGLILVLLVWQAAADSAGQCSRKVAIIGGGVGGSATAFHLSQAFGQGLGLDIFERKQLGGRTEAIEIDGRVTELGASIIHRQNRYFRELAIAMGLTLVEPGTGDTEKLFSIFDGNRIVFRQSSWSLLTLGRIIWRYGLSYFQFQSSPSAMLAKFLKIYKLLDEGTAFSTPDDLLMSVDLYNLTQQSMRSAVYDILGTGAYAARFSRELVAGINHVNYNQNNSLNAMAGMVSMLPTVDSKLLAVKGGNFQLPRALIKASNATLHMPESIYSVMKRGPFYTLMSEDGEHGPYDAVVLATPLEISNISLEVPDLPILPPRKYQTTVTTIIRGRLDTSYFGSQPKPAGDYILIAEGSGSPFSVISPLTDYPDGTRLYKVFSAEKLGNQLQEALFPGGSVVTSRSWEAYPRFHPPEHFASFQLSEGLYYNNAIETAASAMEMSLIAAKNTANLVISQLRREYKHGI